MFGVTDARCCSSSDTDLISLLIDARADIKAYNDVGKTSLMLACENKHEVAAAELIEATKQAGVLDVQNNSDGRSALHVASANGLWSTVARMLSLGADAKPGDRTQHRIQQGSTPVDLAASEDVMAAFAEHCAQVDMTEQEPKQPVAASCTPRNRVSESHVSVALQAGADPALTDREGRTALDCAANQGHLDIMRALLQAGATVNAQEKNKPSPLYYAAVYNRVDVAKMLLKQDADVKVEDWNTRSPLDYAAMYSSVDVVKVLLQHGADVKAEDLNKWSRSTTPQKRTTLTWPRCCLSMAPMSAWRQRQGHLR